MKMLDEKLLEQAPDDIQEILRKSKAQTEEEAKNIKLFGEVNFFDVSFNQLFKDPEYLRRFYREFSQRDVSPDRIEVVTLKERESYKTKISNDLGFYVRHEDDEDELIVLVEAQSTWNPNMPYRFLEYIMATWGNYVTDHKFSKYRAPQFYLPPSRCCLIYTGDEKEKPDGIMNFTRMYHPKITLIPEYVHFDIRVISAKEKSTIAGQYIGYSRLAAGLRTKCKDSVECVETLRKECLKEGYDVMAQFIDKNATKMVDAMEMLINSREIFHDYVQGERQDAAEQGRKEGEKIGEARGVKIGEARGVKIGEARGVKIGEARGVKIGEARGEEKTVVYFYKKGLIPRGEATAKLGVTDQEFEILLQNYS